MILLPLEQAYRDGYHTGLFDLSSSAPVPFTARDLLDGDIARLDALLDSPLEYGPTGGHVELRAAIASLYDGIEPEDVLATAGASEAIQAVAMAVVKPGQEVLMQSPSYSALRAAPAGMGARVREWKHRADFQFDFADLAASRFAGASAVFLSDPHGPSGTITGGAYAGHARLIADEVYRPIELVPGRKRPSHAELNARSISIGDLSKPLGLGGLRIGWIASRDRALLRRCAAALDHLSGSLSTFSAYLAVLALRQFDSFLQPQLARARHNLSLFAAFVDSHSAWLDWLPPQAGYTAFVRFRSGDPASDFYRRLRQRGIFLLKGEVFGEPDYARIGFGLESQGFEDALAVFGDEVRRLPITPSAGPEGDVIVLAKEPRSGLTKTRLAAGVGADAAARLSDFFLRRSLTIASGQARRTYIAFTPADARDAFQTRAPRARLLVQPEGDLGRRLSAAFEMSLADGAQRPVLIGSDCPTLPANLIRAAQRLLTRHDVVLGPAEDGGYYLIGMNAPQPWLFRNIDWSQTVVLRQTLDRAAKAGLRVATLPYWYDIDTIADLERLEGAL